MSLGGSRVVVTGADGFIGSHLTERLVELGASVTALAQYNSFGSAGWLDTIDLPPSGELTVVYGDVRDSGAMTELLAGADYFLHLAALISIPHSYEAPQSYIDTNVHGTLNILQAARVSGTSRVVVASTSEVYGTPDSVPILESHPLRAQSPYAASKVAADQLALSFASSFGTPVVVLRPFNTYGPRQSARAVIITVLSQMLAGVKEIRVGSLTPKRDFTFVSDTVDGFVRCLLSDLTAGEVIQLGTGVTISVAELIDMCREITGSDATVVSEPARVRPESSEVMVLQSDAARAAERLGWHPTVRLRPGLEKTATWLSEMPEMPDGGRYHR